ncbi:MAG: site-specific DNA-methyltransferase, partial [Spirochaetia bacterium]|nr:site-specific DNA-methyltransferase [Spirochaetota bacterium]MDW8113298.1 site-specific DNA-methyltransferase [Spirochaetia bacterium]
MEALQKFQNLLKELFQFKASDLDFGIYRILNYKRKQIKKFIEEDLKNKVNEVFVKYEKEEESQVFNDLYNFFSRYYEEGDFIPQYRYSIKGHKYAIPYNGEEVKLYWANRDQYYIKTGILFRDYAFKAGDYMVIFKTVKAEEELNSNKETKERFFVLDDQKPVEFIENEKVLIVRFQYRELLKEELKQYDAKGEDNKSKQEKVNGKNRKSKQEKINEENHTYILNKIEDPSL